MIKKDGNKTSEKRWVCRFGEKRFQGGPNVIQAHHGVHGTGKKKAIQLCKHTPADVKARLQQEMSSTLRSIAEKETSEVIQIIRQEEAHVDRMASAGIDLDMLVESGQLRLAFPRVSASPTVASAAPKSATAPGRVPQLRLGKSRTWQPTVNKLRSKVLLPSRSPFPKSP